MPTINELLAKRANRIEECKSILEKAEAENRELTADERQQYDRLWAAAGEFKAEADRIEADNERRREVNAAIGQLRESRGRQVEPGRPGAHRGGQPEANQPRVIEFTRQGQKQTLSFAPGTPGYVRNSPEYREAFRAYLRSGRMSGILQESGAPQAALQTDLGSAGGYMVLPEQFVAELLMDVDNIRWIRRLARVFQTTAQTLGAVKRTARMASSVWGSELTDAETTKDTALAFGKRSLTPHYMVGEILVSRDLMRSAILQPEEIVRYEISRDSGELEENGFLTGSGAMQPLGLFTATTDGIDTSRDVNTGNTTTTIGADNLREMKYGLKSQYRSDPSIGWLFHRLAIKQISKLKDGEGQYLWQYGITEGDPDRLLGYPVYESEMAPSTFTTGQYVGLLGAFRFYWIADSLEMDMQILLEKYANTNQIGFMWRRKTDGMPQIAEAFVRSKLA